MAELDNSGRSHADIYLSVVSTYMSTMGTMPRADVCNNCAKPKGDHAGGENCLFDSLRFSPISTEDFKGRFVTWLGGQQLEAALTQIVYELTRADR